MIHQTLNRRGFIHGAGALAASACLANSARLVAQTEKSEKNDATSSTTPRYIRKDVGRLDPNDPILQTYRNAVKKMRELPSNDPRNWERQARIHQDYCPHGNWFFLPWHRAYLYYFEDICRAVTGDDSFALPYWNWTTDRQIPEAFWGEDNPLNHPRDATRNESISSEVVGQSVIDPILGFTDFEDFASLRSDRQRGGTPAGGTRELEGTPHNSVHGFIGGDMSSYMSPRDPIFWLHHANIDRIWAQWNGLGRANTTDTMWTNYSFQRDFVDRNQAALVTRVGTLGSTYALNYRYDDQTVQPPVTGPLPGLRSTLTELSASAPNRIRAKSNLPISVPIAVKSDFLRQARSSASVLGERMTFPKQGGAALPARPDQPVIQLRISEIAPPSDLTTYLRVFINCDYLSPTTPISDPHYVASLSFFGAGHDHGGAGGGSSVPDFVVDLTPTLARLMRAKRFPTAEFKAQVVVVAQRGKQATEILPGKFEVTVATSRQSGNV